MLSVYFRIVTCIDADNQGAEHNEDIFLFCSAARISVEKTPFLFLAHGVYIDWQSPPLLEF